MIITVFVTGDSELEQWQAELLEYSWQQCGPPGDLIRLFAAGPAAPLPLHSLARVERTLAWEQHPYLPDRYAGYNTPAALLEWLVREKPNASILLLEAGMWLQQAVQQEVGPGEARAAAWSHMPTGEEAFGLPRQFRKLEAYCVNRELTLPRLQFPLLIHASDLVKLCPRWLELTGIIRQEVKVASGPELDAAKYAYNIAAAEYRIEHADATIPALSLEKPVEDRDGRIVFDMLTHQPGTGIDTELHLDDAERARLQWVAAFENRKPDEILHTLRPVPRPGVREARVMDQVYLEAGSPTRFLNLNASAAAIWKLVDGQRSLYDIASQLGEQYSVPMEQMSGDVEQAAKWMRQDGALDLEIVAR